MINWMPLMWLSAICVAIIGAYALVRPRDGWSRTITLLAITVLVIFWGPAILLEMLT